MILSRVKFYPQERVDLEDLLTLLSAARTDSKLWTKQVLSGENYILKGFTVSGLGLKQATIEMDNATLFMGQGTQDFSYFISENNPTDLIVSDSDLVDGSRNYVELALSYEDGTPITKAFWDPSANGGLGAEFNQQVNTVTDLQATISVAQGGFSGDPDKLPLCIIDTDVSGNIKVILDRRNLFYRLGSPSDPDQGFTWTSNEEPGYSVNLTGVSGTFVAGETVTFSGGATATVATGGTSNIVIRLPSSLSFASGNTLTGSDSGATGTVNTILEAFGGADKDIDDVREAFMALATEIRRVKGTPFWHNIQGNSMDGISSILNMAIVGLTAGARWHWSGTALSITDDDGTPAATDDLARIRLFGKSQNITLRRADGTASTSTIPLADGEMLFVKLPTSGNRNFSGNGSGDTNYQIVDADDYEINDTNFWLAYRDGAKLYVRGYGELMTGESAEISDPISEQILTFIGADSEADDSPNYTSVSVVTQGVSLVAAISELDQFAGDINWKAPVADFASLPGSGNVDGDARITLDTRIIYTWIASSSSWRPITGGGAQKVIGGGTVSVVDGGGSASVASNSVQTNPSSFTTTSEWGGQSFTPTASGNLQSVMFSLQNNGIGTLTGNGFVRIYADDGSGLPNSASILATSDNVDLGAALSGSAQNIVFPFSAPLALSMGTLYHAVLITSSLTFGGGSAVQFRQSAANPYADGRHTGTVNAGASWAALLSGTSDVVFDVLIDAATTLDLTFDDDMFIEMKGLAYADNTIPLSESPISFPNEGEVAYVIPNFATGGPDLVPVVDNLDNVPAHAIIIARRENNGIIVGSSSTRLVVGQSTELYAQESIQTRNTIRSFDYLRSDEPVTWTGSQIQFTQNIILEQLNTRLGTTRLRTILVANSPIVINDGQILYVDIDRTAANNNVTPQVSSSVPTPTSEDREIIILAKRIDVSGAGYLHLPLHKQVLNPGQTVRLGASGSNSSSDGAASAPIEGFQWRESDSFDVLPTSSDSKVTLANYTNATFNIAKGLFKLAVDKSRTVSSNSGTALVVNLAPGFTVAVGDIVFVTSGARSGQWRRIATVNNQANYTLDAAFSGGDASASDTLMISQAVWTKDLVNFGSASEKTRARDFFSGNITQIAIAYQDSIATDDDIPNLADPACIVASASNEGLVAATGVPASTTFGSLIFTRPTGAAQLNNFLPATNTDQERLHLVFFPSPTNGSVTTQANLLQYEANFYAESSTLNSGVLDNAIGFSDASGTPYNCVVSTPASLTRVALTWSYIPNVKSGSPHGQLEVKVDGKEISRFISSGVTPPGDLYYTEVTDVSGVYNTIQFTQDLSAAPLEITVKRRQGVIDSATQNTTDIALLKTGPTVQKFLSGSGTYTKPANVRWIRVRMVGGGGGGTGGGIATPTAGSAGGNTTFGTLTAGAGAGGSAWGIGSSSGGAGGTNTFSGVGFEIPGANGGFGGYFQQAGLGLNIGGNGGMGGNSFFGGAGANGGAFSPGTSARTNSGSGGGGGGAGSNGGNAVAAGGGGGAGGYIEAIITSPLSTYSYGVGTGGAGGAGTAGGAAGGNGASGIIIVEEFY